MHGEFVSGEGDLNFGETTSGRGNPGHGTGCYTRPYYGSSFARSVAAAASVRIT